MLIRDLSLAFSDEELIRELTLIVFGAVIGFFISISLIIIERVLKRFGKLIVVSNNSEIKIIDYDTQSYIEPNHLADADKIEILIDLDIYNQSDIPKTLGNFHIEIIEQKAAKEFSVKLNIRQETSSSVPYGKSNYEINVPVLTIPPKESRKITCSSIIEKEEIPASIDQVFFAAKFPNNRKYKIEIDQFHQ